MSPFLLDWLAETMLRFNSFTAIKGAITHVILGWVSIGIECPPFSNILVPSWPETINKMVFVLGVLELEQ